MVGKSKVISGLSTHQAHRRRKDTVMGSSVGPDAWSQIREPKGTIGERFEPTFHAGLTNNPDAVAPNGASLPATVTRATAALYTDVGGKLSIAGIDESRQDYRNGAPLGTLMEPASTNKCATFNANPDAALSGCTFFGDAAAVNGRALDVAKLAAGGLERVCTSGYVIKIDNSAGAAAAYCRFLGETGNTNTHIGSARVRVDQGEGILEVSGGSQGQINFTNTDYQRISFQASPSANDRELILRAQPGAIVYCILNQWEESPVVTSEIRTLGSAVSRAVDVLTWPLTDSLGRNILNKTEGMSASFVRLSFADADLQTGTDQDGRFLRFGSGQSILSGPSKNVANVNRFTSFDDVTPLSVDVSGGFVADTLYVIASRWTGASRDIGYKAGGSWAWASGSYSPWTESGILELHPMVGTIALPVWHRSVYLWDEDKGQAWLESYFSGIAE